MMDYSIAFIIPSHTVAESVRHALKNAGHQYPVIAAAESSAVEAARKLLPKGLRLIVSHGITYEYLKQALPVVMMVLPFSGIDTMAAVSKALSISDRVVHMGTPSFYHLIQRSLEYLGEDQNRVAFCNLQMDKSIEAQTQEMIDCGFEVFIGGLAATSYASSKGKVGIEFGIDELNVQTTVVNARAQVENILISEQQFEHQKAVLQASSDALLDIDQSRFIIDVNLAAQHVIGLSNDQLIGKNFEAVLAENGFKNVEEISNYTPEMNCTPVIIKEVPIMVRNVRQGSVVTIKKVSEIQELEYQVRRDLVLKGLVARNTFGDISGVSPAIRKARDLASIYAKYDSTVLISGETGTGKELFAQSIHNASKRKKQPFVAINCASLPEGLIESELFGYVKGAFTGANQKGKQGLFEIADKGTIFLDEISELPIVTQSKLLRVLQEGEIIRIGGDKVIRIDNRVICSSNKDLFQLVKEGKFKNDLYYRLCVLEVYIPPLRERPEDIRTLAVSLAAELAVKHRKKIIGVSDELLDTLCTFPFSGNVRELRNLIERMVILSEESQLTSEMLEKCDARQKLPLPLQPSQSLSVNQNEKLHLNLEDLQKQAIIRALEQCNRNRTQAAALLGVNPSTLWRKMKTYGIQ